MTKRERALEKALMIARVGYIYWRERCLDFHPGLHFIKKIVEKQIAKEFPRTKRKTK